MADVRRLEVGETVSINKSAFNMLLGNLKAAGYQPIGPQVRDDTVIYTEIQGIEQLPQGYVTEQAPGRFRLIRAGHARYFDFIPAAQSWKQFLFPPRLDLMTLRRNGRNWHTADVVVDNPAYAFVGVRACELAAIQVQDRVFIRPDFIDPVYRARRGKVFILAVNCLHPAGTCFCGSMSTGPRVQPGFDLLLTELDDAFLMQVGSELGRSVTAGIPCEAASAFVLGIEERGIDDAIRQTQGEVDADHCADVILENLDHASWQEVASRCLSCGNCTLVCPTCFCWDAVDHTNLQGTETRRERTWDSCFNPAYSYQAGGNTRPTIKARYRQWLSHKFATWQQQYGTSGCVGCGRCITWCPAGIDTRREVAAVGREANP